MYTFEYYGPRLATYLFVRTWTGRFLELRLPWRLCVTRFFVFALGILDILIAIASLGFVWRKLSGRYQLFMSAASLVTLAKAHDPQWLVLQKAVVKWTLGSRSERVCARWLRYLSFYTEYDPNAPRKAITMTDIPNPNETNCEWLRFAFDIHPYGDSMAFDVLCMLNSSHMPASNMGLTHLRYELFACARAAYAREGRGAKATPREREILRKIRELFPVSDAMWQRRIAELEAYDNAAEEVDAGGSEDE